MLYVSIDTYLVDKDTEISYVAKANMLPNTVGEALKILRAEYPELQNKNIEVKGWKKKDGNLI